MAGSPTGSSSGSQSSSKLDSLCISQCKVRLKQLKDEATALVDDHGDPLKNGSEINRRITQNYAELYSKNPTLHWAGAAAYVSKQVGCNIRHAEWIMNDTGLSSIGGRMGGALTWVGNLKAAAAATQRMLVRGNQAIFSDIYPQYKLFAENPDCLTKHGKEVLPGSDTMVQGFQKYQAGDLRGGMMDHAYYEQWNILQECVFDAPKNAADRRLFTKSVKANQSCLAKLDIFGYSIKPQVSFTPDCVASDPAFISPAPGDFTHLGTRWKIAVSTLEKYDDLMSTTTKMSTDVDQIRQNMSSNSLPNY